MMGDDENTVLAYEKVLSHNRMNATALFAIGCCYEKVEDYTKVQSHTVSYKTALDHVLSSLLNVDRQRIAFVGLSL